MSSLSYRIVVVAIKARADEIRNTIQKVKKGKNTANEDELEKNE